MMNTLSPLRLHQEKLVHFGVTQSGATGHIITDKNKFLQFDDTFNGDKHFMKLAMGHEQTMLQ